MIRVNNLHKSFEKIEVLKGINEHIEKGEVVVVIGPSGSGKSTFLRCLNLLEVPTSGEIIFEGKNITDKKVDINKMNTYKKCTSGKCTFYMYSLANIYFI